MPRRFRVPAGTDYPATLADFKKAKAGEPHRRSKVSDEEQTIEAPYDEIIPSWLANGVKEVSVRGLQKR